MQGAHIKKLAVAPKVVVVFCALVVAFAIAGAGTWMWFVASDSVQNVMALGRQSVIVTESFKPVDQVHPGDSVDKEVGFTNEGDMASVFRVKYDEFWTASDGNTLSNRFWDDASSSELDVMVKSWNSSGGFANTALWSDGGDGYYYYNKVLAPGQTTDPVLDRITLNEKLLMSNTLLSYTKAQYNLNFLVDSMIASADDTAIKGHFGSHVGVSVNADGSVTWTFA